jgi:SH3-like domain-containing protein
VRLAPTIRRVVVAALALALAGALSSCRSRHTLKEVAYVAAQQTFLRDRVATVYSKVATVKNGDRLEVLERTSNRRFVRVRTAAGTEGWVEQRSLVGEDVFQGFQKLVQENVNTAVQAAGATHSETNLHLTPGRDTAHLYQLASGEKISILKRASAEKLLPGAPPRPKAAGEETPPAPLEDWWLARDSQGRVGWVLARLVDLDIPLEVAQYAEGQRIMAYFVLREVADQDKKVPEYLVELSDPKEGQAADYNQIRVFTWNTKRNRYETAYRERRLAGMFPTVIGKEDFGGREGMLTTFTLHVLNDGGQISERKYKVVGNIVRRVTTTAEGVAKR